MDGESRGSGRGSSTSLGGGLGATSIAAGIGSVILGGHQATAPRFEFAQELEVLGRRDVDEDRAERRDDFIRECELELR